MYAVSVNLIAIIFIIASIPLFAGAIFLQIYLSKKENRWLGLILPIIYVVPPAGLILLFVLRSLSARAGIVGSALILPFCLIIVFTVPAIVLFIIYKTIRAPRKNKKEIDKMNIQDLS